MTHGLPALFRERRETMAANYFKRRGGKVWHVLDRQNDWPRVIFAICTAMDYIGVAHQRESLCDGEPLCKNCQKKLIKREAVKA